MTVTGVLLTHEPPDKDAPVGQHWLAPKSDVPARHVQDEALELELELKFELCGVGATEDELDGLWAATGVIVPTPTANAAMSIPAITGRNAGWLFRKASRSKVGITFTRH